MKESKVYLVLEKKFQNEHPVLKKIAKNSKIDTLFGKKISKQTP